MWIPFWPDIDNALKLANITVLLNSAGVPANTIEIIIDCLDDLGIIDSDSNEMSGLSTVSAGALSNLPTVPSLGIS